MALAGEEDLSKISVRTVVYVVGGLPLSSFILCIVLSLTLHYEESTATHCRVKNWLPSISAAIASSAPEKYIWRVFVSLHSAPRYVTAVLYRNFLMSSPLRPLYGQFAFNSMCNLVCALNIAEISFLLILTSISSDENYYMHKCSFIGFATSSLFYMVIASVLFNHSGRRRTSTMGEKSFQYKTLFCALSLLSMLFAMYFFYRHNKYCEQGIFSLFALSEYGFVVSNILYHSTFMFDFHGKHFVLTSSSPCYQYQTLLPMHSDNKCS